MSNPSITLGGGEMHVILARSAKGAGPRQVLQYAWLGPSLGPLRKALVLLDHSGPDRAWPCGLQVGCEEAQVSMLAPGGRQGGRKAAAGTGCVTVTL